MRELLFVVPLVMVVACGGPVPDSEESATANDASMDPASVEDPEGEEAEVLEMPPEGALPLSEILAALEAKGYGPFIEIEIEDGVWEIESVVDGDEQEIHVDPITGEVVAEDLSESGAGGEEEPAPAAPAS